MFPKTSWTPQLAWFLLVWCCPIVRLACQKPLSILWEVQRCVMLFLGIGQGFWKWNFLVTGLDLGNYIFLIWPLPHSKPFWYPLSVLAQVCFLNYGLGCSWTILGGCSRLSHGSLFCIPKQGFWFCSCFLVSFLFLATHWVVGLMKYQRFWEGWRCWSRNP